VGFDPVTAISLEQQGEIALQVLFAALAGGLVGLERDLAGKKAGLRTHMLVASASALAVGLGLAAIEGGSGDPTRVFHGIITGVGFIGAGAILYTKKGSSRGITTAATILLVAVLGAACGYGAPLLALLVAGFTLVVLRGMYNAEERYRKVRSRVHLRRRHEDDEDEDDDLD
jgi:putative Mg2+ transporter-C (MgtC) family protein